jgi:hypothetical protein
MNDAEYKAFLDDWIDGFLDNMERAFRVPGGLLDAVARGDFKEGGYVGGASTVSPLLHGGEYVVPTNVRRRFGSYPDGSRYIVIFEGNAK